MGKGGDTTTRQEMSPEARQIMMTVMGHANPLLDKPAVSAEQAAQRGRLADYYNSQDYKAPNDYMRNQGLAMMGGGVAGNPFNNGTRMMTQDRNIGSDPYSQDRNGQRNDFNEVRNGAPQRPQGMQYAQPVANKMAQMPQMMQAMQAMQGPMNKMQAYPDIPQGAPQLGGQPMPGQPSPNQPGAQPSLGGQPMLGGNTKQPMMLPNPNQPMSDEEFQRYMNRYSDKNSISNG